jgi:hypothetical protein
VAKQQDCQNKDYRRGRKTKKVPNENLADPPADPVLWQQDYRTLRRGLRARHRQRSCNAQITNEYFLTHMSVFKLAGCANTIVGTIGEG